MKPLYPSLLFPDTDIFGYRQLPLLLFGCPLNYLQLVEPSPDEDTSDDNSVIIDSGLCKPHIPAPLGDDRVRFTRLFMGAIRVFSPMDQAMKRDMRVAMIIAVRFLIRALLAGSNTWTSGIPAQTYR